MWVVLCPRSLAVAVRALEINAYRGDFAVPGWVISGSADAARQILTTIAAAIITVVGVVFSIILVTLTLASLRGEPGAPPADYAVVWAPPQQFLDEQPQLKALFNIGAGVDALIAEFEAKIQEAFASGAAAYVTRRAGAKRERFDDVRASEFARADGPSRVTAPR